MGYGGVCLEAKCKLVLSLSSLLCVDPDVEKADTGHHRDMCDHVCDCELIHVGGSFDLCMDWEKLTLPIV
jgi:hypothetical protein